MDGDVDAAIEYMIAEQFAMGANDAEGDPYTDYALGKPVNCPGSWDTISLVVRAKIWTPLISV